MALSRALENLIAACREGQASVDTLRDRLASHAEAVEDVRAADPRAAESANATWFRLSELDHGDRDESEVRELLRQLIAPSPARPPIQTSG